MGPAHSPSTSAKSEHMSSEGKVMVGVFSILTDC